MLSTPPPRYAVNCSSNSRAFGPVVIHPERSVSTTSAISSSPMSGAAKVRKLSGLFDNAFACVVRHASHTTLHVELVRDRVHNPESHAHIGVDRGDVGMPHIQAYAIVPCKARPME